MDFVGGVVDTSPTGLPLEPIGETLPRPTLLLFGLCVLDVPGRGP